MRKPWMTDEFIKAVEDATARLDEAVDLLDDAIYEARCVEDDDDASETCDELRWEFYDELDDLRCRLYEMIDDE